MIPLNGAAAPELDPKAAMRLDAVRQAKLWIDAMKATGLRSMLVTVNTQQNDACAFFVGMIDSALWDSGYQISCLSHQLTGQDPKGVCAQNLVLLLRAKGDVAPRVIL